VGDDEAALVAAGQAPARQDDVSRVPLNGGRWRGRYLMGVSANTCGSRGDGRCQYLRVGMVLENEVRAER
jgi:hypothetical protein